MKPIENKSTSNAGRTAKRANLPNVFISYDWSSKEKASDIEVALHGMAHVLRDDTSLKPWGSIAEFMKSIREQDFAVFLISDNYLRSLNCLYEACEFMKDESWRDRAMFVVEDNARDIFDPRKSITYLEYWEEERDSFREQIQGKSPTEISGETKALRKIEDIVRNLSSFLEYVREVNNPKPETAIERIRERVILTQADSAHTPVQSITVPVPHRECQRIVINIGCDGNRFILAQDTVDRLKLIDRQQDEMGGSANPCIKIFELRFQNMQSICEMFLRNGYTAQAVRTITPFVPQEAAKQELALLRTHRELLLRNAIEFALNDTSFYSLLQRADAEARYYESTEWKSVCYENAYGLRKPFLRAFGWSMVIDEFLARFYRNPSRNIEDLQSVAIDCIYYGAEGKSAFYFNTNVRIDNNNDEDREFVSLLDMGVPAADSYDLPRGSLLNPFYPDLCLEVARLRTFEKPRYEKLKRDYAMECFSWKKLRIGPH